MKKLIITVVITAISSLYFVVDAEKHLTFQAAGRGEAIPLGTDIVRLAAEKLPAAIQETIKSAQEGPTDQKSPVTSNVQKIKQNIQEKIRPEKITEKAAELISEAASSLKDLVKKPIEEKFNETFCSSRP